MSVITFDQLPALFACVGKQFADKKDELCTMDARLGDGDLGLTMSKGFGALPDLLAELAPEVGGDCGKLLMKGGMKMSSIIPSTMGFLMSSGIMEGGKAVKGRSELDGAAVAAYLNGFAAGLQKRGKCEAGQRTVYDAVRPAADAAAKAAEADPIDAAIALKAAVDGAAAGVEATKSMIPVYGKAAVHAAQSAGVADQGAVAAYYMILGMATYLK